MKRIARQTMLLLLAVFSANHCHAQASGIGDTGKAVLIKDVTVIDVIHSRRLSPRSVLVEAGRITSIGKSIHAPADTVLVDGRGKFLVPGLIDMHVHLFNNASHRPANTWAFALFVANGVTGVREMLTMPESLQQISQWNEAVKNGLLVAPHILAAGSPARGHSESEARRQVIDAKASGADFIKVFSEVPAPQWKITLDESRRQGLAVDGHVPAQVAWLDSARAGQRTVEHLMQTYEACSSIENRMLAARRNLDANAAVTLRDAQEPEVLENYEESTCKHASRTVASLRQAQVPTLVLSHFENSAGMDFAGDPRWQLLRKDEQERWRRNLASATPEARVLAAARWKISCRIVGVMNAAGMQVLAGTDAPMPLVYPGYSLHDEVELLAGCGLGNAKALQAATIRPAEVLELADSLGSVDVGKRADLVLLDADPLKDIRHLRMVHAVLLQGKLFRREELQALLEMAASKNH